MYYIFGYDEERPEGTRSHSFSKEVQTFDDIEVLRKELEKETGAKIYFRVLDLKENSEVPNEYLTDRHIGRSTIKPSGNFKIYVEQFKTKANESDNG